MADRPQIDRLLVGGVFKTRKWLYDDFPEKGQDILQNAKTQSQPVFCLCRGEDKPILMSVVRRDTRYHIRRYPKQGSAHHIDCVSYGGINERAQRIYTDEALREDGDKVIISLDAPLSEVKAGKFSLEKGEPREHATDRHRRSTISMLGLLNYLWEESGLNIWWPNMDGKRFGAVVRSRLLDSAGDRVIGKGLDLSKLLFIPRQGKKGEEVNNAADLRDHLGRVAGLLGEKETCFAIVVGEISKLIEPTQEKRSSGIVLNQLFTTPLWDNYGLVELLNKRFTHPMQRLRQRVRAKEQQRKSGEPISGLPNDYILMGIFAVGLSPSGSFVLKHGAVMETSKRYIPIASHYEGLVERKLHVERRAFEKPLVYDGERSFFPDFYLLDTGMAEKPVLEVYGYTGDQYEYRKRVKHVEYVRRHIPYWYWDVKASPQVIPSFDAFPKANRRAREGATAPAKTPHTR